MQVPHNKVIGSSFQNVVFFNKVDLQSIKPKPQSL